MIEMGTNYKVATQRVAVKDRFTAISSDSNHSLARQYIETLHILNRISEAHPVSTSFDASNCVVGVVYNPMEERTVRHL